VDAALLVRSCILMTVTSLFSAPWGILFNKRASKLAGGAISRGATVRPMERSRYNSFGRSETSVTAIGMGFVEAVLGVLTGLVSVVAYDPFASKGRVSMRSSGGPTAYAFSWADL
jgi:hypothetical protein